MNNEELSAGCVSCGVYSDSSHCLLYVDNNREMKSDHFEDLHDMVRLSLDLLFRWLSGCHDPCVPSVGRLCELDGYGRCYPNLGNRYYHPVLFEPDVVHGNACYKRSCP